MIKGALSDSIVNVAGLSDGFLLFKTLESIASAGYNIVSVQENLIKDAYWIVKTSKFPLEVISEYVNGWMFVIELNVGDVLTKNAIHHLNLLLAGTAPLESMFLSTKYLSIFGSFESLDFDCTQNYPYISVNREYPKKKFFFQTPYPLINRPIFDQNITSFFIRTFKRKFKYYPNPYSLVLLGLSFFVLRSKPSKRVLVVEKKIASDGLYALNNFGSRFNEIFSMRFPKIKFSIIKNGNKYLIFSSNFEQSICAVIANGLKKFKNIYFSMPGGRISSQVLYFIKYETNTIHIAHGRVSSDKFLSYTKYVFTEVFDSKYFDNLIRQKRIILNQIIKIVDNDTVLFLHGYKKGSKYSFKNLYQDLKKIARLSENFGFIIIRPHPTAFLLKKFVRILWFFRCRNIQVDCSKRFFYKVKEVYVSSPTFALKLSEKEIPFTWIGQ